MLRNSRKVLRKFEDLYNKHPLPLMFLISISVILLISLPIRYLSQILIHIPFFNFGPEIFVTDADSGRYILSALAQSEAAIIGIVFTVILIIFQMSVTTNPKNPEIIRFLKSKTVIVPIILFAISIAYDLLLLSSITDETAQVNVFLPICLIIFLILVLIPVIEAVVVNIHKKVFAKDARTGKEKFLEGVDLSCELLTDAKGASQNKCAKFMTMDR